MESGISQNTYSNAKMLRQNVESLSRFIQARDVDSASLKRINDRLTEMNEELVLLQNLMDFEGK